MQQLFEYFHKTIKIDCNSCNAVLSQQWKFIFLNSGVHSEYRYIFKFFKVLKFLCEGFKLCWYNKSNLPLSHPCNCCSKERLLVRRRSTNAIGLPVYGQQGYFQHLVIPVSHTHQLHWCCILLLRPFYLDFGFP